LYSSRNPNFSFPFRNNSARAADVSHRRPLRKKNSTWALSGLNVAAIESRTTRGRKALGLAEIVACSSRSFMPVRCKKPAAWSLSRFLADGSRFGGGLVEGREGRAAPPRLAPVPTFVCWPPRQTHGPGPLAKLEAGPRAGAAPVTLAQAIRGAGTRASHQRNSQVVPDCQAQA